MARVRYGKTWWGNAWVSALERIDCDTNRLPRGRSYANANRVSHLEITPRGNIKARVKGTRSKPYNVEIGLGKFDDPQKQLIQKLIRANPLLASELSMGKLPESMLELLSKKGINLLPHSWEDIAAYCSCPDWANPCKHLAAVYYMLANEIDKDPYILFALRRMSKDELLEGAGFAPEQESAQLPENELERLAAGFVSYQEFNEGSSCLKESSEAEAKKSLPDLSLLADNTQGRQVFSLLREAPLFSEGRDFKKSLLAAYQGCSRAVDEMSLFEDGVSLKQIKLTLFYPQKKEQKDGFSFFVSGKDKPIPFASLALGEEKTSFVPNCQDGQIAMKKMPGFQVSFDVLIDYFLASPLQVLAEKSSAYTCFLGAATGVARALARSLAFVPVVNAIGERGDFAIFYKPLNRAEGLQEATEYLNWLLPPDFIFRKKDKAVLPGKEAVSLVLQLILTRIMHRFHNQRVGQTDELERAFFLGEVYRASSFEKKQTGKAIANWLAWLNLDPSPAAPIIKIGLPAKDDDRFRMLVYVENKSDALAAIVPLAKVFSKDSATEVEKLFSLPAAKVRSEVSKQLTIAGEHLPVLKEILTSKGKKGATVSSLAIAELLGQTRQVLTLLGIRVMIPKELKKMASPTLSLSARTKTGAASGVSYLNLEQMLSFSWQISLGDKQLSGQEFRRLVEHAGRVIKYKDEYVFLRPEEVKRILEGLERPEPELSSMEVLRAAISGEVAEGKFLADQMLQKMIDSLTDKELREKVVPPKGLLAKLRPYQGRGLDWLYGNATRGIGSCLADDMGLGKTLQVIALILKLKQEAKLPKPVLVVCPTTLIGNWDKEVAKFAPSLKVNIYHGSTRQLKAKGFDLIITSYGTLRRDVAKFKRNTFEMVVIDEAQNIKNPDTDQTKAVKSLKAGAYIAMTGTPVENRLLEMWSIFDFINRGFLSHRQDFVRQFANPIEKYRDSGKIEKLKTITAPFILRRVKGDKAIIKDLPEKLVKNEYCYLSKQQAALYQKVTESLLNEVEGVEGIARKGIVFKLITALKQICNHPSHYTKGESLELDHSGKALKTVELLQSLLAENEKALIFTQYKEMGDLLKNLINKELAFDALFFHGGLTRKKRDEMIDQFQSDASPAPVMIVSLKAGGTGLNLTAASNVIHYDLWWNPAVEDQATDRTYRIGQTKNVMVHRLISIGTFEERINEMIDAKRELAELTVAAGEARITEMTNEQLKELFVLK